MANTQGDPADGVWYNRGGKIRLAVVTKNGREATVGIFSQDDCFGEGLNASAYNHGAMGYIHPNIDRIAKEGALFTDCRSPQCGLIAARHSQSGIQGSTNKGIGNLQIRCSAEVVPATKLIQTLCRL